MIPDKLIAKLRAEYNPPLPPKRVADHIQKELNELLEYIEVFARRGQFSESFRYPNEVFNLSSEVDLLARELLFMGFGVQIKGECLDVQWRYPEHGTRAHGFRKEAETAFVVLVFGLTVVKVTRGDPMQGFDHSTRPEMVPADPAAPGATQ